MSLEKFENSRGGGSDGGHLRGVMNEVNETRMGASFASSASKREAGTDVLDFSKSSNMPPEFNSPARGQVADAQVPIPANGDGKVTNGQVPIPATGDGQVTDGQVPLPDKGTAGKGGEGGGASLYDRQFYGGAGKMKDVPDSVMGPPKSPDWYHIAPTKHKPDLTS